MKEETSPRSLAILVAEDNHQTGISIQSAVASERAKCLLCYVKSSGELLDYLHKNNRFSGENSKPLPDLILLDLDFEKLGQATLHHLKADPHLRAIPLIALIDPLDKKGADEAYECGASSCIVKPATPDGVGQMLADLEHYWLNVVKLPNKRTI